MLHIVQMVIWGVAGKPQLFTDEEEARAAYVACAQKQWEQRYAAYCEHHCLGKEAFLSAQSFLKTIDVSEKSTVNFWAFNEEQIGLKRGETPQSREVGELRHAAGEMAAVKERLATLLHDVSQLTERLGQTAGPAEEERAEEERAEEERAEEERAEEERAEEERAEEESAAAQTGDAGEKSQAPSSAVKREKQEADPAKYRTREWENFVATIKRLCCGSRNDCDLLPRDDWRHDVYSNVTTLQYWDWVAENIERYKEEALAANYSVIEDATQPGYYKFENGEGTSSESYYSEWEAWCAAGIHHQGSRQSQAG